MSIIEASENKLTLENVLPWQVVLEQNFAHWLLLLRRIGGNPELLL
jgi:hypothetical protein